MRTPRLVTGDPATKLPTVDVLPIETPTIALEAEAALKSAGALRDYWYVGCLSKDLQSKPVARVLFGEQVVLWRDAKGVAHAARDRCLHRGAALSHGEVHDGLLCCP